MMNHQTRINLYEHGGSWDDCIMLVMSGPFLKTQHVVKGEIIGETDHLSKLSQSDIDEIFLAIRTLDKLLAKKIGFNLRS